MRYIGWSIFVLGILTWLFLRQSFYNGVQDQNPSLPSAETAQVQNPLPKKKATILEDRHKSVKNQLLLEKKFNVNFDPSKVSADAESQWGKTYKKILVIENISSTETLYTVELQGITQMQGLVFRSQQGILLLENIFIDGKDVTQTLLKNQEVKTLYPGDWVSMTDALQLQKVQIQIRSKESVGELSIYAQIFD